jgi:hypothetical protein
LHAWIGELADDHGLAGTKGIAEHAGDLDGKRLGLRALENGPDFAVLTGLEFVERDKRGVRGLGKGGAQKGNRNNEGTTKDAHYSDDGSIIRIFDENAND